MILDYSQFIPHRGSYGKNSPKAVNRELFYSTRGVCPFCSTLSTKTHNEALVDVKTLPGAEWHKVETVWSCVCGWWEYYFYSYINGEREWEWDIKDWELTINSGSLRKFDVSSQQVPINILKRYLQDNASRMYDIHHKKMEELVGAVFREHYACDAHVVGKSNDGGVDLVLLESDIPTVVQVKRRTASGKTESVKEVRDLLGATGLYGARRSIFVTTADKFELYNFDKFSGLLKLQRKEVIEPWKSMIQLKQ
ncbi:restriction endonuclease [Vibrio natriegens]|uniref:restriction endonuclease n=1 Tax=Vibrio natriegens TaxID=691 RepID=UPI001EFE0101|nr:restriction endonuclease [Vibrio natriegens]MCG9703056.1 restriction endonuclease [Vibrio natriegens]